MTKAYYSNQPYKSKKIVSVEVLNLDEVGYGPKGSHTRRQWREECLNYFEQGADAFLAWQKNWLPDAEVNNKTGGHFCESIIFEDGSSELEGLYTYSLQASPRFSLDFAGYSNLNYFQCANYQFLCDVIFSAAIFHEQANFDSVKFLGQVHFNNAHFINAAVFQNAEFFSSASFI